MLTVERIINKPVASNCFVIYDSSDESRCIIVDPGTKNNEELLAFISSHGLMPEYIILTHEHFDHCWGVNDLVLRYHVPIMCSALCGECIKDAKRNCSVFYENTEAFVIDTETISVESLNFVRPFGNYEIRFFMTPGHTNAGISFTIGTCLFTGDALIKGLRTVTKLPTGSSSKLKESFETYHMMQGKGYVVCAGHGESFLLDGYDVTGEGLRV